MSKTFKTSRRVEFHDTDAAGIVHFVTFFEWMEEAEHELLRHLGLSVITQDEHGTISWPRVHASCDYQTSLKFEEVVGVEVGVERLGRSSVTYGMRFSKDGARIAVGKLVVVCCRIDASNLSRSITIPDKFSKKLSKLSALS